MANTGGDQLIQNSPFVKIGISLPNGTAGNTYVGQTTDPTVWQQEFNFYNQPAASLTPRPIDQTFDIRVYLYPTDISIFDKNPEIWLFRQVRRSAYYQGIKYRADGQQWVHPSNLDASLNPTEPNNRYYSGGHSSPELQRISQVPLDQTGDFYGGSSASKSGTSFPFRPLAWFRGALDIANLNFTFPQPMHETLGTGAYPFASLERGYIYNPVGPTYGSMLYHGAGRRYKQRMRYQFALALMIENPDYDGGTQQPRMILASEFVPFVVHFKKANLRDTDGFTKKFAIDWKLSMGWANNK